MEDFGLTPANIAKMSLADLWRVLETKSTKVSEECLYNVLKEVLAASTKYENQKAVFKLKRLQCVRNILCSSHGLMVLCLACALVHLACSALEIHDVVIRSNLLSPLCDALEWAKGDLNNTTTQGKIRLSILDIIVKTILQLTSGSVKTHDSLHTEHIIKKLHNLINPEISPLFINSTDKKDIPKMLVGKKLQGLMLKMDDNALQTITEEFYRTNSETVTDCSGMHQPPEGFIVELHKDRQTDTNLAWGLANSGNLWVSDENLNSQTDTWQTISPTAFITNTVFWAQIGDDTDKEKEALSNHLRDWPDKMYTKCAPPVGSYVGYHHRISDIYHRCQVIDSDTAHFDVDHVTVVCLDTGRVIQAPHKNLFLLLPEMKLKQFRVMGALCRLHGVTSPPISTKTLELVLTAMYNLATVTDRLDLFNEGTCHNTLLRLSRCGQLSIMWRALRVLSNMAASPVSQMVLLKTDAIKYVLSLCEKYPSTLQQKEQDIRLVLQSSLRLLANLMWECTDAKKQFVHDKGIEILCSLIRASTADVTAEAFQTLKSYLGRTVISSLTLSDMRTLRPDSAEESDALAAVMTALSAAESTSKRDTSQEHIVNGATNGNDHNNSNHYTSPTRRPNRRFGMGQGAELANQSNPVNNVHDLSAEVLQEDLDQDLDLTENASMIRNEPCGFQEDEMHAFMQVEKNNIQNLGRKPMLQLACGFLNSDKGGSVYLGINKAGAVVGMDIPRYERDQLRMGLDMSLSNIKGNVLPNSYLIRFWTVKKVFWHHGQRIEELIKDLLVTEIELKPNYANRLFYLEPYEVCLREGDKTIEATACDIQTRQVRNLESTLLMDLRSLQVEIQQLEAEL